MKHQETLEFTTIKEKLAEHAVTEKAKNKFRNMDMILEESKLRRKLKETTEARIMLDRVGAPPLGCVSDIIALTEAAKRGEMLSINELDQVRQFAVVCERMKRYLKKSEESGMMLAEYGHGIYELQDLRNEIERCIRNGIVDDYATKTLCSLRRQMAILEGSIKSKLDEILRKNKAYFSESFVSGRNGRFTLPVRKEYKYAIQGSVVDISSTGATCFIEPAAVAKLREELELLRLEENNEVRKILYQLSGLVYQDADAIKRNVDYLEELDYIFAKGKLSVDIRGVEPAINLDGVIHINEGRHPLIDKKVCVPLTIDFGDEIKGVIITGPNTGGKTVALKTVGLCLMMANCGLHVACTSADVCMRASILCDIGDGQSISENLSTFSSHITNIIDIMRTMNEEALVLLDELGSGTDPAEGMGIAVAVLDELRRSGCRFMVTTHYPEIKEYAKDTPGIINARMAFDKESLRPLYQLEIGEAGESCAFYIAMKLGFPQRILERAYEAAYKVEHIDADTQETNELQASDKKTNDTKRTANQQKSISDISSLQAIKSEVTVQEIPKKEVPRIQKTEVKRPVQSEKILSKFQKGDSVLVYPQKKIGIVFEPVNEQGDVIVQIQKKKLTVNHKRVKLQVSAAEMYPEDYDFSIVFDSVDVRKKRHQMERKYQKDMEIVYPDPDTQKI